MMLTNSTRASPPQHSSASYATRSQSQREGSSREEIARVLGGSVFVLCSAFLVRLYPTRQPRGGFSHLGHKRDNTCQRCSRTEFPLAGGCLFLGFEPPRQYYLRAIFHVRLSYSKCNRKYFIRCPNQLPGNADGGQ